jgi:hypothetical protein
MKDSPFVIITARVFVQFPTEAILPHFYTFSSRGNQGYPTLIGTVSTVRLLFYPGPFSVVASRAGGHDEFLKLPNVFPNLHHILKYRGKGEIDFLASRMLTAYIIDSS